MLKHRQLMINLVMMVVCWMVASFGYYLINFYEKYIEGNIFVNNALGSIAEPIAFIGSGVLLSCFRMKRLMIASFMIPIVFALTLFSDAQWVIAFAVFMAKLGNAAAFSLVFLANSALFPPLFISTCFGVCNIGARLVTILAPMVAEIEYPYPAYVFIVATAVATLSAFMLKFPKQHPLQEFEEEEELLEQ